MSAPRWAAVLLSRLAPPGRAEEVVGDLEEAHRRRVRRRGRLAAELLTGLEALDIAVALLRERACRWRGFRHGPGVEATLAPLGRSERSGRSGLGISWLDLKLGFRMLVKYPGLTLVGGLAMAFAICVGAGTFAFLTLLVSPTLPLDDGDRVVAVRNWDASENRTEPQVLHDFVTWREELRSIEDLGAYRDLERNLMVEEERAEPVRVAEISARAFRVARVPPHRGRTLNAEDEEAGAPAVLVIGYDVWQSRFGGDPDVVGRTVRLGGTQSTVVGVMPEGFEFPLAHDAWTPLRLNPLDYQRGEGPGVRVFGRLAHGFSLDEAQAELTALGQRAAAELDRETAAAATGDTSRAAFLARFAAVTSGLERRLLANPAVTDVTFAGVLPRTYHGWNQIEVDEGAVMPRDSIRGHRVSAASIDPNYFAVLGTPILSGRPFHSGDVDTDARIVIVNQPFVDRVLGGANPVGRRLRYVAGESARAHGDVSDPNPWYEIVGVVRDLGTTSGYGRAGFYHPLPSSGTHPVYMVAHVNSNPASFAPQLRAAAMAVDYALRLEALMPLDEVANEEIRFYEFWYSLAAGMTAVALLLSLAGVYAVMSFTVSRRTREIGIRVALGADPRRIALAILRRPLAQVGLGVVVGAVLVAGLMLLGRGGTLPARHGAAVVAYAALMMGVCMLACVVPARRALRIEPTEALKEDA